VLGQRHTFVREAVSIVYSFHQRRRTRPDTAQWLQLLRQELQLYPKVYLILDALDEYGDSDYDRLGLLSTLHDLEPRIQFMITSRVKAPSRNLSIRARVVRYLW